MPKFDLTAIIICLSLPVAALQAEPSLRAAAANTPVIATSKNTAAPADSEKPDTVTLLMNSATADPAAPTAEAVKQPRLGTVEFLTIANILFANEQTTLSESQTAMLDQAITRLKQQTGTQRSILVSAHADDDGDDTHNMQLSHSRANAVANYLSERGVNQQLIRSHSLGRHEPRNENWTDNGRELNRRVTITLIRSI